ncbi:Protein CBR-ATG-2 [Caenorhabditis briggsae]|uniref:Autophagy-related protein 2 n=1 Tax=Caenorhabditis briggsae TaxID=6238 RepID=A8XC81_CAEBR|nr:Protein CBR-ATG-2 [Caenorhabditis briggsae]CAP30179.1 Protein CBR-ATG-2 [Caenorhabditis briggsae]
MSLHTVNRVWCKIMIQRYLGVWLDNNLSVDQLSLELVGGSLELENLDINTKAVSAGLAQASVPLKLVDGYVGRIKIEIPWVKIMVDPTKMCIEDLQLTFRGSEIIKMEDIETFASMIESVLMSLSTDDMARSVLDEVTKENSLSLDFLGTGETADSFSGFINAVYSRFCLTIKNLTLRFENEPKDKSEMATAVEIHVQMITFMDEQMRSCEMDNTNATDLVTTQPHGVGTSTNLNKNLTFHGKHMGGVRMTNRSLHPHRRLLANRQDGMGADEDVLITSMHIRREKAKQMSPTKSAQNSLHPEMFMSAMSDMDAFHSCYDKLTQDCPPSQLETIRTAPMEPELFSNPIKCAEVIGDVSCVFRIKNAADNVNVADIEESKIETDIFVKGINVFATSSQLDIVKRFFASFTAPKEIVITEQGKPMNKEDYENMAKNMEPNQSTEIPIPTFGGNWNAGEEFREFEDVKSLKKEKEKIEKEKFKSLRANANIREEFTVKTHIGTFLMYIPHCDFLSADYAKEHGGSATALSILQAESSKFFNALNGYSFLAKHGLATIREAANAFYPKDHLRIVGGSLDVTSSSQRIGGIATFSCRVIANHFDILEYLTPESAPGSDGPMSINILDYSNQENAENDPNFKLILRKSSENKAETKLEVLLGAVKTELDLSIIDRISNLIVCRPFFDEASKQGGRRDKVPQLKDDLYADAAGDESVNAKTLFNLRCPSWQVDLRIPKADLRDPTGSRLPFSQRHVHNEYLALGIKEIDVSIPIGKEVPFIEILCSELYGDFCGEGLCIPPEQKRILYASKSGFDKINLTMKFAGNPDKDRNGERTNSSSSAVPDIMMKSISADIMMSHPKKEGPFSKTPRAYCSHDGGEKEEIIQAGSRKEILAFQQECEKFASTFLLFTIPTLKLHIPEKGHLEVLYNRFVNDLALFQPAAPAFRPKTVEEATGQPTESFQECVSPKTYAESEHSDLEDDVMTVKDETEGFEFNRDVRHTFVLTMNANRCAILCNTAVKDEEKAPEASQVALDLDKVHFGTTAGYHGDINHTYFHFTSSKAAVGSVCTTRGQRIPNVITAKDFGKWSKDFNQLEHVPPTDELSSGSTEDAFAVALHMSFKPDINVKDVLLGIAIRNSLLQARPIKNWGAFWITQLADLFTLQDYAIPGYVLPTITTDLHICLENDIIGYDHSWIIPSSKLKLRAALGHCNLASCIVSDMSISKTLCIFEHCRLYMSHDSVKDAVRFEGYCAPRAPTKKFMPFLEFGSLQLDILFAVGNETGPKTTPAFEIRCQNDIINAWACADSLATFIQTIMEYTSHEQVPTETPEDGSLRESLNSMKNDDITKSVATESVWSDASTGSKHVQKMAVGMDLPNNVSKRMQAMILEAAVENEEGAGIAIGEDAVKEFAMNEKKPTTSSKSKKKKTENFEQMVPMDFAITDEEFCMVDDNVFGSGITTLPGESRVRPMPGPDSSDEPPIKVDFFQCIEESGNDGLYQTMSADDLTPALRYFLKDVTLRLSLYAGNDLSTAPSPLRTYCTEEYRNGYGPEQKIEPNSAGGPNRDHSAFVVLELSKITYLKQVFEKTAPQLSTTLFQIGDVVIKDCVRASTIQEMLYQYSATSQPRRSSAPIFSVRMTESQAKEGKMRVSMLPIKINVDQDTLEFLSDFFEETSRHLDLPKGKTNIPLVQRPVIEVPAESNSRRTSPKTSVSSSEGDVTRMYPSLPEPSLTSEPLRPSPVHPATPLGDLSYLEKISSNHQSPVKRPIIDAPLTTSAMSIGKMFDTPRVYDDEEEEDEVDPIQIERTGEYKLFNEELRQLNEIEKSPADTLFCADYSSSESSEDDNNDDNNIPKFSNKLHEFVDPSHPADLSDLAGDWAEEDTPTFTAHLSDQYHNAPIMPCRATEKYCQRPEELEHLDLYEDSESGKGSSISTGAASSIKPRNKKELSPLKMPPQPISHEDILMRSTMMGSIHPTHSVHNLVDTGDDMDEHSNFLDSLDDDDDQEKQKVEQELEEDQKKEEEERSKEIEAAVERGETFFKQFVFSPEVNIYVDYQGKRKIAMEKQGALVGLLMAFGQLNQMPITLRKIDTRTGLLGSGRCMQHAVSEWSGDMLTNMPSVIASYGPISPLVQIGRGVVDLFWMPVSEFRKNDGNVIKGVQRGVGSFSVSSAAGIVGMAQTVTGFVQSLAEITMNEIKPDDPSNRRSRRYNRNHGTNPTDVRHSLQLAYGILYDGYQQTRDDLELAAQEDRASGNSVVRSAFRYAVPTFLGPIVMATQVTYQLLGGLRNQLRPDTYQDERRKWGEKDVPGGVNN